MWFLPLLLYTALTEPLSAQGENRLILNNGSNPCNGYIGIYHGGKLGFVGHKNWNSNTEKVVCKSTHCGVPVHSSTETAQWDISNVWLNELDCTGNEAHLWDCKHPGWNISYFMKGSLKKIKCSNEIKIRLDGYKCAGAVQYSTDGKTYSGYICAENFGQNEADLLCKSLKCGTSKEILQHQWMGGESFKGSEKMAVNCSGINDVTNLWQCAQETSKCQNPASVMCTGFERLQLKGNTSNVCSGQLEKEENDNWIPVKNNKSTLEMLCKQMHCGGIASSSHDDKGIQLTCTDNVKVVLMDENKPSMCYGEVHITVNNSNHLVCASTWTTKDAEVVCRELNCGRAMPSDRWSGKQQALMDNVKCSGHESSLWHCRARRDHKPFQCSYHAYVICAKSVTVRLTDGPSSCAGRVEIQDQGRWQRVSEEQWTNNNSDTVCKELNCGSLKKSILPMTNPDKFSQGSGRFRAQAVDCKPNTKRISECLTGNALNKPAKELAVGVTCEEHKVVFLKGNESCSGKVGIEHNNKIYWLSGSNETWNEETSNTICQQKDCGAAVSTRFISRDNETESVWGESYSCSHNATSLFNCKKTALPSNHNNKIVEVKCKGNINVNLTNECWGTVNVCISGSCGDVCEDSWTDQKSVMLCKNLGCGDKVLEANSKPKGSNVKFKSLHLPQEQTNLNQCNLVRNDGSHVCSPAYVVCSGSVKSRFHPSRDKCSGNVEVSYEGRWLPVCTDDLKDIQTQSTICSELRCGQAVRQIEYFRPTSGESRVTSIIKCSANSTSLTACDTSSKRKDCILGGLQCSKWRKMELTVHRACGGAVFVHSQKGLSGVSSESWTKTEGERLCQDLDCGKFKSYNKTTLNANWITTFSCAGVTDPKNIWECENETVPSQQSNKEQLFLECQDEPEVALSDKCHGDLSIDGTEVCAKHWKDSYSHMVCQDQTCGNGIDGSFIGKPSLPDKEYYHVSCEENHHELGQCKRFKGKCEGGLVSVDCVDNVKFNTTEKCGGQIEVNYRNKWEKVCPLKSFPPKFKNMLCKKLGCESFDASMAITKKDKPLTLETALTCTTEHCDIKYCIHQEACNDVKPAEIYCNGYVIPQSKPFESKSTPIVPIILGVGFLLVLVILIVVLIRICIVKKAKNASLRMSRKEVAFESGDYDDVTSKANEMEDLSRGRFRSESQVITENDARSTSSFPYDDIDDMAQPLTSQAATAGASGDNYINEGAIDQSADGVTYEVDDPQENYDDIGAGPEITQTEAEVHYSPEATPECSAAASLGLVQGDEDYLAPDQDR